MSDVPFSSLSYGHGQFLPSPQRLALLPAVRSGLGSKLLPVLAKEEPAYQVLLGLKICGSMLDC